MSDAVIVQRGDGPVILGMPHVGTHVPDDIFARLNAEGRVMRDTDWRIEDLYRDLTPGLTVVQAIFHRYVIDANRDPSGKSLYPGASTTELIPTTNFDGQQIWSEVAGPDQTEIARRLAGYHAPYHAALAAEIDRVREKHGVAILYDCHSIRSVIPWLFAGTLPDFNIGTNGGTTCDLRVQDTIVKEAASSGLSSVLNGRFKGGWTTRHYGQPKTGVHAIQMELAQSSYLETEAPPFALDPAKAAGLRPVLARMLTRLSDLAPALAHQR